MHSQLHSKVKKFISHLTPIENRTYRNCNKDKVRLRGLRVTPQPIENHSQS